MIKLAILASGGGSNANQIIKHFQNHPFISVVLIVTNNPSARVLNLARISRIPDIIITKDDIYKSDTFLQTLKEKEIDVIILAGFLWLIPSNLIEAYPDKILNIHPSLLPKYGGKGMYGHHVHDAVKTNGEQESGMTIHIVNKEYDDGNIIFQEKCSITESMSSEDIAKEVLKLEHKNYSKIIEQYISNVYKIIKF
ncbi:MAG: phosphoribosylglycinamide formyltransferase [Saprospiraceae bacterium]|nr:phosphoribosylglycinamide formyltransferase [Saprospiraceae bacterium]